MNDAVVQSVPTTLRGRFIYPGDGEYDDARRVFNARVDMEPAVIARCGGTADVVAALKYALENDLEVAVRGGGRHMAGYATTDGGIVIDLGQMKSVRVDPATHTACIEGGATGGDVQIEAGVFGLGGVTGVLSHTGVSGATLGGGVGFLSARAGWGCDNVISADLVTADGRVITVSADENPDLFGQSVVRGPTSASSPRCKRSSTTCRRSFRRGA